jgi:hypothetical protein
MAPWDAMVALVEAGLDSAAFPVLAAVPRGALRLHSDTRSALAAFDECAAHQGARAAQATLDAYLGGRQVPDDLMLDTHMWVTSLPEGLEVQGYLSASLTNLKVLPDGLKVGGDLRVDFSDLVSLPRGLVVGGRLDLMNQPSWDGEIPEDARIGGCVFTDRAHGVTLAEWRAKFPEGEGAVPHERRAITCTRNPDGSFSFGGAEDAFLDF